jgi:hypothetical protein
MTRKENFMKDVAVDTYYAGTVDEDECHHLLIDVHDDGAVSWSVHSVDGHEAWCVSGMARFDGRDSRTVLVLGEPAGSGASALLGGEPLNREAAPQYLAGMMSRLPKWPYEIVMDRLLAPIAQRTESPEPHPWR